MLGYGIDFSVKHGFEKVWPFFSEALPTEEALSLTSMPYSVRNYRDHFARFGLDRFSLMAVDYWNKTANIYFMIKDASLYPPERIAAMIQDLGFKVPSQEELEINAKTVCIYHTFSWESDQVERLCFVLAGPADQIPTHIDPLFTRFVNETPIQAEHHQFTYNTTYARRGDYLKIEADYTGTIANALGAAMATVLV